MNFRDPKIFLPLILIFSLLLFFFLWTFNLIVSTTQIIAYFVILAIGLVLLILILFANTGQDPYYKALESVEKLTENKFHQKLSLVKTSHYRRYYPPNTSPFYGFIFYRETGDRKNVPMSIVVHQQGGNFHIVKVGELSDQEALQRDPFLILGTSFKGSPIPEASPEQMITNLLASQKARGVEVNVNNPNDETLKVTGKN